MGFTMVESGIQTLSSQLQASTSQSAQIDQLAAGLNQLEMQRFKMPSRYQSTSSGLTSIANSAQSTLLQPKRDCATALAV